LLNANSAIFSAILWRKQLHFVEFINDDDDKLGPLCTSPYA